LHSDVSQYYRDFHYEDSKQPTGKSPLLAFSIRSSKINIIHLMRNAHVSLDYEHFH